MDYEPFIKSPQEKKARPRYERHARPVHIGHDTRVQHTQPAQNAPSRKRDRLLSSDSRTRQGVVQNRPCFTEFIDEMALESQLPQEFVNLLFTIANQNN